MEKNNDALLNGNTIMPESERSDGVFKHKRMTTVLNENSCWCLESEAQR